MASNSVKIAPSLTMSRKASLAAGNRKNPETGDIPLILKPMYDNKSIGNRLSTLIEEKSQKNLQEN